MFLQQNTNLKLLIIYQSLLSKMFILLDTLIIPDKLIMLRCFCLRQITNRHDLFLFSAIRSRVLLPSQLTVSFSMRLFALDVFWNGIRIQWKPSSGTHLQNPLIKNLEIKMVGSLYHARKYFTTSNIFNLSYAKPKL